MTAPHRSGVAPGRHHELRRGDRDTAPTRVDEVLGVAVVHALLAQVAATKMVVTALIELEEHLTQARTIGW